MSPMKSVVASCIVGLLVLAGILAFEAPVSAQGESVYSAGLFELGDAQPPAGFAGVADIDQDDLQPGPDWAELFDASGRLRDDYPLDESGAPLGNGVPDFVDLHGGYWATFSDDWVSRGEAYEGSALTPDGRVERRPVPIEHDLGNAYLYSTFDAVGNLTLFTGIERLSTADSVVEIELNQDLYRLGHGGYGRNEPWTIDGERTPMDLRVVITLGDNAVERLELELWDGTAWARVESLIGEGCDEAERWCAVSNAAEIAAGPWPSYDELGEAGHLPPHHFVEVGLNIGALVGVSPEYVTAQLRTPADIAFGYLQEGR